MKSHLKIILKPFFRLYMGLVFLYVRFKGNRFYKASAIRRAKRLHRQTGKRYRVFFLNYNYHVYNRLDIQRAKHEGRWGWHVNSTSMDPLCFFDTNAAYGFPDSIGAQPPRMKL
jgi:hypothetical protein